MGAEAKPTGKGETVPWPENCVAWGRDRGRTSSADQRAEMGVRGGSVVTFTLWTHAMGREGGGVLMRG